MRYTATGLPVGTRYLRIHFPAIGGSGGLQLVRVVIDYGSGPLPPPDNADYVRLQYFLEKLRRGEQVTAGFIGGSITAGANAYPMNHNRWATQVCE